MNIPQYNLDGLGAEFKVTEELEHEIAALLGVKHCIMTTSGTAAAAELAGCELFFVANNEIPKECDTYVHVSLNGRDCDIEEVIENNPNINIVEDACQAFGSKHNGK